MLPLFSLTAFVSAALLFLVEPMFARMILPLLGGTPAVWNSCVVFYQIVLFAGYLYAHVVTERLRTKPQLLLQAGLLALALIVLPISVGAAWVPPTDANPIGWVFRLLLAAVALPFFVVATSGPLLQRWFSSLGHPSSSNPYVLYAASNLGSLLALLAYPLIVEPTLRLQTQSQAWTAAYIAFIVLMGVCGAAVWKASEQAERGRTERAAGDRTVVDRAAVERAVVGSGLSRTALRKSVSAALDTASDDWWATRLRWLGLAVVPSTLMLSVTTFISTDVAAVPLLWVVPLSLYLLTFVIAFANRQFLPASLLRLLFPIAVVVIVSLVLAQNAFSVVATISFHLAAFFVIALACHGELAATKPPATQLTEFYLWLSAGGAVGGLFNTLVAPQIFVSPLEYPLAAIAACALLLGMEAWPTRGVARLLAIGTALLPTALLAALVYGSGLADARLPQGVAVRFAIVFAVPLIACYAMYRTPVRMGVALTLVLFAGSFVRFYDRVPLYVERTFFGIHKVMYTGTARLLQSGTTNHGAQSIDPRLRCEPLTYYSRGGPIGQLFDSFKTGPSKSRFGVVGLGTASMASYAAPGQAWTFFEINPAVERIARDPAYFTYLRDCAPDAKVILGDARLSLAQQPDASFDLLVLDAFSSDAIPVHLITVEAMALYVRKLAPGGLLALHISNRYLELTPVVAAVSRQAGLTAVMQVHTPTAAQEELSAEITPSRWTVLARRSGDFGPLTGDTGWQSLDTIKGPVWTDDYSNVFRVVRW